ncbi:dihydrofolate reductase family protein [Chryseolinea sp. T2]|uniref:dihydrofolate reductase family protein n=1 Tax=Chryseolinea sp. T2 TaxID=3129255 RepID=UPI00307803A7
MGRVMSLINVTPDGFADGKYVKTDAEYFDFIHGLLSRTDTVAFGRNSFEMFQTTWPSRMNPENATPWQVQMAKALHAIPKIVYSSTLKSTTWHNSTIAREPDPVHIKKHKADNKGGILTIASPQLLASFTRMGLIDDYYFCIQPLLGGQGDVRLFDRLRLDDHRRLRYVGSTDLLSGVHIVHYECL